MKITQRATESLELSGKLNLGLSKLKFCIFHLFTSRGKLDNKKHKAEYIKKVKSYIDLAEKDIETISENLKVIKENVYNKKI